MEKKIKILNVVTDLEICNGVTSYVMNYYKNINKEKFEIDFIVCQKRGKENYAEIEKNGGKIFYLEQIGIKNFIKTTRKIKNFFKEKAKNYDVIHCHMLNNGAFFLYYAKKYGIKNRILHSHVTQSAESLIKKIRNDIIIPISVKNANYFFACSNAAGKTIFKKHNFQVIKNAIQVERFAYDFEKRQELRKKYGLEENFIIGNIGRLSYQKNQKFLIEVFNEVNKKNNNIKLILIGNGPLESELKELCEDYNICKDVVFIDSSNDIQNYYQMFDLFVLPSNFEGLGIVLIEAQISGLHCVVSDKVPEEAKITENFESISLNNSKKIWADKIIELSKMCNNRKTYSKEAIISGYEIKNATELLENSYMNMCKENNSK